MHQRSTRAEITRWSFDNEYHFGDFRGDAEELLRRGYDIHVHFANFGRAVDPPSRVHRGRAPLGVTRVMRECIA